MTLRDVFPPVAIVAYVGALAAFALGEWWTTIVLGVVGLVASLASWASG